ncbi:MAG TPA: heavy metal translocating P-type ATPase [Gemmatimonadaceae bacterium]|nr:heavy metal translocating P-type ATPase [Gemmatimonadaceae bacterium]
MSPSLVVAGRRLPLTPIAALLFLVGGAVVGWRTGRDATRDLIWLLGLLTTGVPVVWGTLRGMLRGQFAADIVAAMAIVGAAALGEPLAGLVVVLMQTGGEALDAWAVERASNAVAALEADAPRQAHRREPDGRITDVEVAAVRPDDMLLVRAGELVPCDGIVVDGVSLVDTSRLTGEPVPVRASAGTTLPSGAVNGSGALTLRATRIAAESQYARIVDLVRSAQASKSPLQRLADRWAIWFTPFTLLVCLAAWLLSHDATRVLAVLVVATPCPLILAAPVAFIGGVNRAARRAIIVRHGGALEALARVDTAVFDKTGTLTIGRPDVQEVSVLDGADRASLLADAAAVEQGSGHLLARVLVAYVDAHDIPIPTVADTEETAGRGVRGRVGGRDVVVGSARYVAETLPHVAATVEAADADGEGLRAWIASEQSPGGAVALARVTFADRLRPDLPALFARLSALGVTRTELLSGDHVGNVAPIADALGISHHAGDLHPEDKLTRVRELQRDGRHVLMVGDGTNDAPALSLASVGVALAGHGGGVSAEAADVVLLVDDPDRVADALAIGRDTMRIARQSIAVGIGLSVIGMGFALAGLLPPTLGALAQEVIDVAVIVNALRAARG